MGAVYQKMLFLNFIYFQFIYTIITIDQTDSTMPEDNYILYLYYPGYYSLLYYS